MKHWPSATNCASTSEHCAPTGPTPSNVEPTWPPTPEFPRSSAVSLPRPATELLTSLAEVLEARGTRWYVFGAQAVILWGAPRLSADVDVTVQIALEEAADLAADMERAGFELRIQDVEGFVAQTRVLPCLHVGTQMPVDVVLAGAGLEELFPGSRRGRHS